MKKVSELLYEERVRKNLSLEDIEATTKIKKQFLEAIESGQLRTLPSKTYALGFVKVYAQHLGLPLSRVTALFKREYEDEEYHVVPEFRKKQHAFNKKKIFSPRGILVIAVGIILFTYLFFQYNSLFFNPSLSIKSPKDKSVISAETVEVDGKTDQYATVSIDGDEVYVDIRGQFKKSVFLFPGEKIITVIAKNRFGKETKKQITLTVK